MSSNNYRSHAPHAGKKTTATTEQQPTLAPPSQRVETDSARVSAMLEELDDVIFSAVQGDASALQQAHLLWPQVVQAIGWELVEQSREQYLRYAIEISRNVNMETTRSPENTIAALEVISLLTRN